MNGMSSDCREMAINRALDFATACSMSDGSGVQSGGRILTAVARPLLEAMCNEVANGVLPSDIAFALTMVFAEAALFPLSVDDKRFRLTLVQGMVEAISSHLAQKLVVIDQAVAKMNGSAGHA